MTKTKLNLNLLSKLTLICAKKSYCDLKLARFAVLLCRDTQFGKNVVMINMDQVNKLII